MEGGSRTWEGGRGNGSFPVVEAAKPSLRGEAPEPQGSGERATGSRPKAGVLHPPHFTSFSVN